MVKYWSRFTLIKELMELWHRLANYSLCGCCSTKFLTKHFSIASSPQNSTYATKPSITVLREEEGIKYKWLKIIWWLERDISSLSLTRGWKTPSSIIRRHIIKWSINYPKACPQSWRACRNAWGLYILNTVPQSREVSKFKSYIKAMRHQTPSACKAQKAKNNVFHKTTWKPCYLIFSRMFPTSRVKTKFSSRPLEIDPQDLVDRAIYTNETFLVCSNGEVRLFYHFIHVYAHTHTHP